MLSGFKKNFILTLFFSLVSSLVLANENFAPDSVGVLKENGNSYILHEVEPRETLFGISRRYQTPVGDIVDSNAELKAGLKIGQTIKVPFIPQEALPEGAKLHKVGAGETLFSISKAYEVTVDDIKEWNGLLGNDLSIGQGLIIKDVASVVEETPEPAVAAVASTTVAVSEPETAKETPVASEEAPKKEVVEESSDIAEDASVNAEKEIDEAKAENQTPLVPGDWQSHTVQSGETLFSIANQYNARVEDLISWNALSSNNLTQGQVLKVGRGPIQESTVPVYGTPRVVSNAEEAFTGSDVNVSSGGFKNIKETGQAELIVGTGSHKKYLVLHRTAPIGTIMRVKNEENDVTIFARVVGTLPETGDNEKLVIKLSQAAFDQLKAVNSRFPVEIMY